MQRAKSEKTFFSNYATNHSQTRNERGTSNNAKSAIRCNRLYENAKHRQESIENRKHKIRNEIKEKVDASKSKISTTTLKYSK
jgi:hypothetical protein